MSFSEMLRFGGTEWGLLCLALILLYMFILRLKRTPGFLGIAGTVSTVVLIGLLLWQGTVRYSVMQEVLAFAAQPTDSQALVTLDGKLIEAPKILPVKDVRYIIDLTDQKQTRYLPWNLILLTP